MSNEWLPRQKLFSVLGSRHCYSPSARLFACPYARPAPANQRRDFDSPHGLRPLLLPVARLRELFPLSVVVRTTGGSLTCFPERGKGSVARQVADGLSIY
jgi:hypothetical protein